MSVNAVTGLDHVIIRADDLDVVGQNFARLGFKLTERRINARGGSNHTAVLDDHYIELGYLPPDRRATLGSAWGAYVEGLAPVALKTPSSALVHDQLVETGYADVIEPAEGGRPVNFIGHGDFQAHWITQRFPAEASETPTLFTCQHLTRDLVHRRDYRDHPNGAIAVLEVLTVLPDPAVKVASYQRLFGEERVTVTADGFEVKPGSGVSKLRFVTPDAFQRTYPQNQLPTVPSSGWYAGWVIGVASQDAVGKLLKDADVAFTRSVLGGYIPNNQFTAGALIEFR